MDFYEHDEAEALYAAAGELAPQWRTLIELGMDVGLRHGGDLRACTGTGWTGCGAS